MISEGGNTRQIPMSTTNATRKNESIIDAFEAMDMDDDNVSNNPQLQEALRKS
jgi:hypothetical protein